MGRRRCREGVIVAVCHAVWFISPCRSCAPAARRPGAAPHLSTAHTLRIYLWQLAAQHEKCACKGLARRAEFVFGRVMLPDLLPCAASSHAAARLFRRH